MKIVKSQDYLDSLKDILYFIAQDSKSASQNFYKNINIKIRELKHFPYKYRESIYFPRSHRSCVGMPTNV